MAEITKSGVANLGSQQDIANVKAALEADGELVVVDDPEPESAGEDEEGNELPPAQPGAPAGAVEIKVANVAEEEAPAEE